MNWLGRTLSATVRLRRYAQETASLIRYFPKQGKIAIEADNKNAQDFLAVMAEELVCEMECFSLLPAVSGDANGLKIYVE